MATATSLIPIEEYLRSSYHPDRDYCVEILSPEDGIPRAARVMDIHADLPTLFAALD